MRLVHFPLVDHTPHLETDLELIQDALDRGDSVAAVRCRGELVYCPVNPEHDRFRCLQCIAKIDEGFARLRGRVSNLRVQKPQKGDREALARVEDQNDLRKIEGEGVALGVGVLADTIARFGYRFDPDKHRGFMSRVFVAELQLLRTTKNSPWARPDRFIIFNGRFSLFRTMVEYSLGAGIPYSTHERGGVQERYRLRDGALPHDIAATTHEMKALWKGEARQVEVAGRWFDDRRNGLEQSWIAFTKSQEKGSLPAGFDPSLRNIVLLNSTIEEYETIDCWKNDLFPDEVEALGLLFERYADWKGFHFYIRLHPNLRNFPLGPQMKRIRSFPVPANVTIIMPEERVHTYALLDACEKVLVFGSTVGIEAVYWGKPCIQLGKSMYLGLKATYQPKSLVELDELVRSSLPPPDPASALPYGLWEAEAGEVHKRFSATGVFSGTYEGKVVEPSWRRRRFLAAMEVLLVRLPRRSRTLLNRFRKDGTRETSI